MPEIVKNENELQRSDDDRVNAALADSNVIARVEGKTVGKVIVVPGKLVNLVVK
jgi:leucyl-tRNA synthetase